jgi:hypothetical protein
MAHDDTPRNARLAGAGAFIAAVWPEMGGEYLTAGAAWNAAGIEALTEADRGFADPDRYTKFWPSATLAEAWQFRVNQTRDKAARKDLVRRLLTADDATVSRAEKGGRIVRFGDGSAVRIFFNRMTRSWLARTTK